MDYNNSSLNNLEKYKLKRNPHESLLESILSVKHERFDLNLFFYLLLTED